MLSQVYSSAIFGVDAYLMEIEVNFRQSPRSETVIVGLPDAAVKESKDRVLTALANSGFVPVYGVTTINLAPADIITMTRISTSANTITMRRMGSARLVPIVRLPHSAWETPQLRAQPLRPPVRPLGDATNGVGSGCSPAVGELSAVARKSRYCVESLARNRQKEPNVSTRSTDQTDVSFVGLDIDISSRIRTSRRWIMP